MAQTSRLMNLPDYPAEIQADPRDLPYTEEAYLRMYSAMTLARTFEEKLGSLYRQGKIFGAVYLGMGQEATSVGCISLLEKQDVLSTVARNLSAWFYRGEKPERVLARWFGKDQSPSNGRELGLFLADLDDIGIFPYHNGSMASWIPAGAGFALTMKLRKLRNIVLCFTGDGATSPGDFYEGLNLAAIHKLPLVIICEVNQFAYSTPIELQMPVKDVAERASAFNIYSETAFGNDLFTVIDAARRGIEHARSGKGPALIEFKTFRQRGHGEHDDMGYVSPELRDFWEKRDPIGMYRRWLIERAGIKAGMLTRIDEVAVRQIEEAVRYAESLPYPLAESVTDRLFAPSPHDVKDSDRENIYEPIEHPAVPSLTARQDRSGGGHF